MGTKLKVTARNHHKFGEAKPRCVRMCGVRLHGTNQEQRLRPRACWLVGFKD